MRYLTCSAAVCYLATILSTVAFDQVQGKSLSEISAAASASSLPEVLTSPALNDNIAPHTLADLFENVLFRSSDQIEGTSEGVGPMAPTGFGFVPGHYYSSNYSSRVITEYDAGGAVVGSYTVPSTLGEEVRGLAFGRTVFFTQPCRGVALALPFWNHAHQRDHGCLTEEY